MVVQAVEYWIIVDSMIMRVSQEFVTVMVTVAYGGGGVTTTMMVTIVVVTPVTLFRIGTIVNVVVTTMIASSTATGTS